jgi:hypothetical protein
MKKLYILEVIHNAYVWAEDEDNAEEFASEILKETPLVTVIPLSYDNHRFNPLMWDEKSLVYHSEKYDIELKEAFQKMKEQSND